MASFLYRPSKGGITNPYSTTHRGIDFGWGNGYEVYAAEDGMISYATVFGYGKQLTIAHGDILGKGAKTKYSHLQSAVKTSGAVKRGQLIGYKGNTGIYSKAVHLHFELLVNFGSGYAKVNPTQYFTDTAGGGGTPILPDPPAPIKKKDTMRLALDPLQKNGTANIYWVVGNGAPIRFQGNQAAANEFANIAGPTHTPTAAQWNAFIASVTPAPAPVTVTLTPGQIAAISAGIQIDADRIAEAVNNLAAQRLAN